ncbi:hypothetical protein BHYA_0216g00040 [Botrytis hyacinthi]|uniref:Uncharacterized protein n=1 Tax=Botrytis hyacinthi TaxID=278943 RepID=A0A4Z1GHR8_9HELO|nr:hypothetical protein BHYA_0216g00040 [Botrytis hyacinthi]
MLGEDDSKNIFQRSPKNDDEIEVDQDKIFIPVQNTFLRSLPGLLSPNYLGRAKWKGSKPHVDENECIYHSITTLEY